MKKLLSLVMAGAMVLSLVPATAFAKGEVTATAKVVDALKKTADFKIGTNDVGEIPAGDDAPELQLKVSAVDYKQTGGTMPALDVTVSLDNANFTVSNPPVAADVFGLVHLYDEKADVVLAPMLASAAANPAVDEFGIWIEDSDVEKDEFTFTLKGKLAKDYKIVVDMVATVDNTNSGKTATVSVDSKAVTADDLVFCSILDTGITASVKKVVDIAEEELTYLDSKGIKIKADVDKFYDGQRFELKLSNGFAFTNKTDNNVTGIAGVLYTVGAPNDNIVIVELDKDTDEFTIEGADIQIEADTAKSGAVATLTVKALKEDGVDKSFSATTTVEVAKVCDYKVNLTVDEDEDVPVIYSGVNVKNDGLTDDSDHWSLEVTAKETFPGAWSMRQGFNFNLPEGVYVAKDGVKIVEAENFYQKGIEAPDQKGAWATAFTDAYQDGSHENFEFAKRVFDDVNTELSKNPAKVTFKLQLVADPTFEGDVVLTLEGALIDTQTVTIAKFVKPYTVKAEQNDVIIDYRNTAIETPIVVTEAAAGLWAKNDATFFLAIEKGITFEDVPEFTVDSASEMTLKSKKATGGKLEFTVDDESDSVATVTITDMELYMERNIPAGAYDLLVSTSMSKDYVEQDIYAPKDADVKIKDISDYDDSDLMTIKEAFINVVTSGRDQDNLFTTKVVVPVGESYLVAGETKITLDAPAYISAAGYTMLPVRAVSRALGVDTNNVLWSAETKTVTIMFAQRIISMTVGQKTVYVNGSAIPASAAPEIKDGRTFLPLRDLGTALGVSNVSWDSATKTATLN